MEQSPKNKYFKVPVDEGLRELRGYAVEPELRPLQDKEKRQTINAQGKFHVSMQHTVTTVAVPSASHEQQMREEEANNLVNAGSQLPDIRQSGVSLGIMHHDAHQSPHYGTLSQGQTLMNTARIPHNQDSYKPHMTHVGISSRNTAHGQFNTIDNVHLPELNTRLTKAQKTPQDHAFEMRGHMSGRADNDSRSNRNAHSVHLRSGVGQQPLSGIQSSSRASGSKRQSAESAQRPSKMMMPRSLAANEVRALRLANPHSQLFEKHLSKVILSVQNRKKATAMQSRMESQDVTANYLSQRPLNIDVSRISGPGSTISGGGQTVPGLNLGGVFQKTQLQGDSPRRSSQKQLMEITEHGQFHHKMVPVTAAIKGLISNDVMPKALDPTKQVNNLLQKLQEDKDRVFIPLELDENPQNPGLIFKEAKNQRKALPGQIIFTKAGFVRVAQDVNDVSDFVSKEKFIQKGVTNMYLGQIPFFKKFHVIKAFKHWRDKMRYNAFSKTRGQLAQNFIFSKPVFSKRFKELIHNHNEVRFLKFLEIKPNINYGKHQQITMEKSIEMATDKSNKELSVIMREQERILSDLKKEIMAEDAKFKKDQDSYELKKLIKNTGHSENLIMFSADKARLELVMQKKALLHLRHYQFNRLVQFMSRYLCDMLIEVLYENVHEFKNIFCNKKSGTQFEISLCFNDRNQLSTDPTVDEHKNIFHQMFNDCEENILRNNLLQIYMQDMGNLMFTDVQQNHPFFKILQSTPTIEVRRMLSDKRSSKGAGTQMHNRSAMESDSPTSTMKASRMLQFGSQSKQHAPAIMPAAPNQVASIMPMTDGQQSKDTQMAVISKNTQMLRWLLQHMTKSLLEKEKEKYEFHDHVGIVYKNFKDDIIKQLTNDISQVDGNIQNWKEVEEIAQFSRQWDENLKNKKQQSTETNFYKDTWEKISRFNRIIEEKLPTSYAKLGTIMLETNTLRKILQEMPKKIQESIRANVTQTMESETKELQEQLTRTKDTLEPTPHTLNVYVEQVNMLKLIEQKKEEYKAKHETILKLRAQCQTDGIRVAQKLLFEIGQVTELYEQLPSWEQTTKNNLKQNKETMEQIMRGSSNALSKKIKLFQKRYQQNYLEDKDRLNECDVTLEELFKRSKAIHEIRSKVTLYKEFLKLLYEDEQDKDGIKIDRPELSCTTDYQKMQEIHNTTLRLWKILLYWRKRKTMCYTTPFQQLDLTVIVKSIAKVKTFFEKKLTEPKNAFVYNKSKPLTEATIRQVHECSTIVDFAIKLRKDSLYQRHWEQIFMLIKAQHLKNSTTFTLVDLRDHNIQNYEHDVSLIIEHAKTERQYEEVFNSIKAAWEDSKLKVIPFKDSLKDYVLVNTDIMQSAIEENLGTLENLQKSAYANHVSEEISKLVVKLRRMLHHLDAWVQAQKHWITLDPVYSSNMFDGFFGENITDFLECRSQYRRIMWSSYRNQKATYNLMIDERIKTFVKLTNYYAMLQKRVHDFLEEKRMTFTRFFFLNDSQFLDFLMLAHSNHDFSVYINLLFQGAQKLYINRIQAETLPQSDNLMIMGGESQESDFETRLEQFMQLAKQHIEPLDTEEGKGWDNAPEMPIDEAAIQKSLDTVFQVAEEPSHVPKDQLTRNRDRSTKQGVDIESEDVIDEHSEEEDSLDGKSERSASSLSLLSDEEHRHRRKTKKVVTEGRTVVYDAEASLMSSTNEDFVHNVPKTFRLRDFSVMGLVSTNKELFLFDRHIPMANGIDQWLFEVEQAMQATSRKLMKSAIERFVTEPIEEWALDYPQQVSISCVMLILSHEITEILCRNKQEQEEDEDASKKGSEQQLATTGNESEQQLLQQIPGEVPVQIGDVVEDPQKIIDNQLTGKKAVRGRDNKKKDDKDTEKISVYQHQVIRASENRNAVPVDEQEEEEIFMQDAFGANAKDVMPHIEESARLIKQEEQRTNIKDTLNPAPIQNFQKKASKVKKQSYKDTVHQVLMHAGLNSLYVRIIFWINKICKVINLSKQESWQLGKRDIEFTGVQRLQLRSLALFLKNQAELVNNLIQFKVTEANDFEWVSKLRISWKKTIQGESDEPFIQEDAVTECGGWTQLMGYEYLGTHPRLMITPLTHRYFLFMSSTLRQKQQVMFQNIPEQQQSVEIAEEFSVICAVPFRKFQCGSYMNLSHLMQVLNGCAMARVWMFFEELDNLPLHSLSTLIKEIQLIQQQYTVKDFQALQKKQDARQDFMRNNEGDSEGGPLAIPSVGFGIFGSISSSLKYRQPNIHGEFAGQISCCFRVVATVKPDLNAMFKNLLFIEGFSIHDKLAKIITDVISEFKDLKQQRLYHQDAPKKKPKSSVSEASVKIPNENQIEETIALSQRDVRLVLKLACILRNQEYCKFYQNQLDRRKQEDSEIVEKREIFVRERGINTNEWETVFKTTEDFVEERNKEDATKNILIQEKFCIELNAIQHAITVVLKQKFQTEWQDFRRQELINKSGPEREKRHFNRADLKPKDPTDAIDLNQIEVELDTALKDSWEKTIKILKDGEQSRERSRLAKQKMQERHDEKLDTIARGGLTNAPAPVAAAPEKKVASRRPKLKKESFLDYEANPTNVTPSLKRNFKADASLNIKSGNTTEAADRKGAKLKHSTTVKLNHDKDRELKEEKFQTVLYKGILQAAEELEIQIDTAQIYNCLGIIELLRRKKSIVLLGPLFTGKTQLLKLATLALRSAFNVSLRTSLINPSTFGESEIYGPSNAVEAKAELNANSLQGKSVFQIILQNYEREKKLMSTNERDRLIQSIFVDSQSVPFDLSEAFIHHLQDSNLRERDYQKEIEFLLDFSPEAPKMKSGNVQHSAVRFPNGNVTMFPSDIYLFWESQSLAHASPTFVSLSGIVTSQQSDLTYQGIFQRSLKQTMRRHDDAFDEYGLPKEEVVKCCREFVLPFIAKLGGHHSIKEWTLWNMKAQTLQFFIILNSLLSRLFDNCKINQENEDPMAFPIDEMGAGVLWNLPLIATIWSYGAVLNGELRAIYDDQFSIYKAKFNLNLAQGQKTSKKVSLFELYFDLEQLQWVMITEKLDYKIRVMFDTPIQSVLLPTAEFSQACFMQDTLLYSMGQEDEELNKHFRLVGPSGSQKSVILRHSLSKLRQPFKSLPVPMSAYLTLEKVKEKVEDFYIAKKKNNFVLKEGGKPLLISIDDVHLQQNLNVQVLEFLRSWTICKGYFDVNTQMFKRIANFGTMMTENSEFKATSKRNERFLFYTTTLFCEEIEADRFKNTVQYWLTSNAWETSDMIKRFYIIITNALMALQIQLKNNEQEFGGSSLQKLHRFQFIAKFTSNLVIATGLTDNRNDVFGERAKGRKEEEAMAEIFCYEAMRTFGDRIMRPKARVNFLNKLDEICRKEFRWDRDRYDPRFLESLVMGNYHDKPAESHIKMVSLTNEDDVENAKDLIHQKITNNSGNQMLSLILDSPSGLGDLYRVSRTIFKEQQHVVLVGQPGSSKQELMHLVGLVNETLVLEINCPCYGQPLQFAEAFRNALLTAVKMESTPVYIIISDQQLRDPVYYDFVYNYISQAKRLEECILFDKQFQEQLCQHEEESIRKQGINQFPAKSVLFRQAVERLMKFVHIAFLFSDLMAYKEIFMMFPQLEYTCEVMFLDDLNPKGYQIMAGNYLERVKITQELIGPEQNLTKALVDIRRIVRDQLIESFTPRNNNSLLLTIQETGLTYTGNEFVFADPERITAYLFDGKTSGSFSVQDPNLRQTLLNTPLERQTMNKHRFGMFMELYRFLYDFLAMHLTIRKTYLEAFRNKCMQFIKFFDSVKDSKKRLHGDQNNHNWRLARSRDSIKSLQKIIYEKHQNIKRKTADIKEIKEELSAVNEELEVVLNKKDHSLTKMIDDLSRVPQYDFGIYGRQENNPDFLPQERLLVEALCAVIKPGQVMATSDYETTFLYRAELNTLLDKSRSSDLSNDTFEKLQKFIHNKGAGEFVFEKTKHQLSSVLYNFLMELYRKANIKNTMATTYQKVNELKSQIVTNEFSINYSEQSITEKETELNIEREKLEEQMNSGVQLSKKIEEAEISHMRTEQIFESVRKYQNKIEKRLRSIQSRSQTLKGDALLFAASVVYFGPFSPKERTSLRKKIIENLEDLRQIQFNENWHTPISVTQQLKHKTMFTMVLEDMGLGDYFLDDNLPSVLSKSDLTEAIFSILFAPSCPVICDPTGQLQEFIKTKFLLKADLKEISGADLHANDRLTQTLWNQRFALVTDINCMNKTGSGLSQNQSMLRRLSQFVHNGYDHYSERQKAIRELKVEKSFFSHFNQNRRMPTIDAGFEHLSLYQAQIFQCKFDYQLNDDYLQNATFITATTSELSLKSDRNDQNLLVEAKNRSVTEIKKIIMKAIVPDSTNYKDLQERLRFERGRVSALEKAFENQFLVASEQTLKDMTDYTELRRAVEDMIDGHEQVDKYNKKLRELLTDTIVISDAARIIYLMYTSLKIVSKVMNEVTYSWNQFAIVLVKVIEKTINEFKDKKAEELAEQKPNSKKKDNEFAIDEPFFKNTLLPQVFSIMQCNVKTCSASFFNLVFSLQIAHSNSVINEKELQFCMNQFVALREFWLWRTSAHRFVEMSDQIDPSRLTALRNELFALYPEISRPVFSTIERDCGTQFKYEAVSVFFQKGLRQTQNLTVFQLISYGFLCPDLEFKSRLVQFMYTQLQETFEFIEDPPGLHEFLMAGDWKEQPVSLISSPVLNPVNLITSIANFYKKKLLVLRADPCTEQARTKVQPYDPVLQDKIMGQLMDFSAVRQTAQGVNIDRLRGLAFDVINEAQPTDVPLAKQHWNIIKKRQQNLDEGSLIASTTAGVTALSEAEQIEQIYQCAMEGSWVLICPVQFPQYATKLREKLFENKNLISEGFRLIFDFQGTAQNEIPDTFLFDQSATFQLSEVNMDEMDGFSDIWSRVVNEQALNLLQEVDPELNHEQARQNLRNIEAPENSLEGEEKALKIFENQTRGDPQQAELFKQYVQVNHSEFSKQYNAQKAETWKRIQEERKKEEQRKIIEAQAAEEAVKAARFRTVRDGSQRGSSQQVGEISSSQRVNEGGSSQRVDEARMTGQNDSVTANEENIEEKTDTSATVLAEVDRGLLRPNTTDQIRISPSLSQLGIEENSEEKRDQEEFKSQKNEVEQHFDSIQASVDLAAQEGVLQRSQTDKFIETQDSKAKGSEAVLEVYGEIVKTHQTRSLEDIQNQEEQEKK